MELLKERIRREGKVLPGNIIKVDGFLNHRVDTALMSQLADEFAKYFDVKDITMVLTAEASGIPLATVCAQKYGVPMVFAKKAKSDNIEGGLYQSEIFSYTYKKKVTLIVAQEWLGPNDRVLIIDDFMAKGYAMQGLIDIVKAAGAELVGIGVAVEKGFQHGGDALRETMSAATDTLLDDLEAIGDQFRVITDLLRDLLEQTGEELSDRFEDISDQETSGPDTGCVANSRNTGTVEGDINVAGIVGSMAIEYDFDPEDDLIEEGDRSLDFRYQTKAVVRACMNRGGVTGKRDYAGGVDSAVSYQFLFDVEAAQTQLDSLLSAD